MTDPEPTLLLTRPEDQSKAFLSDCETLAGRRLPALISPVMEIVLIPEMPDPELFDMLVFTSGNGVRSALASATLSGKRVLTVGERTAELARKAGANAEALGENVDAFLSNAHRIKGRVLYCHGVHTRGDIAERLKEAEINVVEAVIYDQISKPPTAAAQRLLGGTGTVIAPIFSPRTARLLGNFGTISAPISVIAMSQAIADSWTGPGYVRVIAEPTAKAMCLAVLEEF